MEKVIFLLGVEGCGHHALTALLTPFTSRSDVDFQGGEWHRQLILEWSKDTPRKTMLDRFLRRESAGKRSISDVKEEYESIAQKMHEMEDVRVFIETCSFPYDKPRKIDRAPDIEIFDHVFSKHFDVRYVYLERSLAEMVSSALRRKFTESSYEQYKIAKWNRAYIESFVSRNLDRVLKLSYDQLLSHTDLAEDLISKHIGESVCLDQNKLRRPSEKQSWFQAIEAFIESTER